VRHVARRWPLAAFAAAWTLVLAASAMLTRHPIVMGDESHYLLPALYGYSQGNFARWQIVEQIPIHLFYAIYGAFPVEHVFMAAKVLNSILLGAAAIPAFAVAHRFVAAPHAALFAAIVISAPICSFTRHFMPESAFHFGFWCLVYLVLQVRGRPAWQEGLAIGACAGLLTLIKPHALAVAAGIALYLLARPRPWGEKVASIALLGICVYLTRVVAGFVLAGTWEPLLAGHTYTRVLLTTGFDAPAVLTNVAGHGAALLLLAGLPLGAICFALLGRHIAGEERDLILLSTCILAALVGITVYFSFSVYLVNPVAHPITRLHGRYYAYALPLVMLSYAALVRRGGQLRVARSTGALAIYGMLAAGCLLLLSTYDVNILVDYVDLGLVSRSLHGYTILGAASFATLICAWWFRPPRAQPGAWRLLVPIAWWAGVSLSTSVLFIAMPLTGHRLAPGYIDRSLLDGSPARELVGRPDGMIVAISPMAAEALRAMFHLRSLSRGRLVAGDTLNASEIPPGVRWLLLLPGVRYDGPGLRRDIGGLTYVTLPG